MMTEQDIQARILKDIQGPQIRLFRANCGIGWQGYGPPIRLVRGYYQPVGGGQRISINGGIYLRGGHKIQLLPAGFSDIFGVRAITIPAEMVGKVIGQALTIEVKRPGGTPTKEQRAFLATSTELGCMSGVATSSEEAWQIIL
jgi:hypothetical protein